MISFDSQAYVFISLADGPIVYYLLDIEQGLLYERKKVSLGTKPTTLTICHQTDLSSSSSAITRTVLFACSDHPTVISSTNNKIIFSSVNLREIVCMCSFNSEYYGSSLTLVTDLGVLIGRIDDIQKLHVRSVRLGQQAQRIIYMNEENAYIILTQYINKYQTDNLIPISKQASQKIDCLTKIKPIEDFTNQQSNDILNSIVILDQHTHEGNDIIIKILSSINLIILARASVKLLNGEEGTSLCIISFTDDNSISYIAVGTTIISDDDDTVRYGRIILFRYKDGHLNIITEKEINGPPYRMASFHGKLLVAIGNTVRL